MLKAIDWLTGRYWSWRVSRRENREVTFGSRPEQIHFQDDEAAFRFRSEEIRLFSQIALAVAQQHAGPNGLALAFEHPAGKYEVNIHRTDGMTAAEVIAEAQCIVGQMDKALPSHLSELRRELRRVLAMAGESDPLPPRRQLDEEINRRRAEFKAQINRYLELEARTFEYEAALAAIRNQVRKLVDSGAVPEESYAPLRAIINEIYGSLAGEGNPS